MRVLRQGTELAHPFENGRSALGRRLPTRVSLCVFDRVLAHLSCRGIGLRRSGGGFGLIDRVWAHVSSDDVRAGSEEFRL